MKLMSPVFEHNGFMPERYTCHGQEISPPLIIENIPENAKTLALIMDDPDAPRGVWIHWVVFDMPVVSQIDENAVAGKLGTNDSNVDGNYGPPCPPSGTHRYFFKIYALDAELKLNEGITKQQLEEAMEGHILDKAELIGLVKA